MQGEFFEIEEFGRGVFGGVYLVGLGVLGALVTLVLYQDQEISFMINNNRISDYQSLPSVF